MENKETSNYFLQDWLKLHKLTESEIRNTILQSTNWQLSDTDETYNLSFTAKDCWNLTAKALTSKLPKLAEQIEDLKTNCEVNFSAQFNQNEAPYTLDRGKDQYPLIKTSYKGKPADFINIAHEFGHALQLHITSQDFIPSVLRELAAFISELSLLEYLSSVDHEAEPAVRAAWNQENQVYLHDYSERLIRALDNQNPPYDYRWNYPIARHCAIELYKTLSTDQLLEVLKGHWTTKECIELSSNQEVLALQNYLPEVPEIDKEKPAINAYRSVGMMTLLDLDYWQGESESSIEDYYANLLKHLQNQSKMIAIDTHSKPIGYVTWEVDAKDPNVISLTRQSSPFGDHLEVQKKLKAFLPDSAVVTSKHQRSARQEQTVW